MHKACALQKGSKWTGIERPMPHMGALDSNYMLQETLFAADPTCALCQQQIHSLEDAQVDHIVSFAHHLLKAAIQTLQTLA